MSLGAAKTQFNLILGLKWKHKCFKQLHLETKANFNLNEVGFSLADMTGVPHSNHTTIEEEEAMTDISLCSPHRRGSHNLTDGIDLESMESDILLDPSNEIDEILKKAASSLTSSRNSQTSDESPRRCSEEDSSGNLCQQLVSNRRKNSIGIQVAS